MWCGTGFGVGYWVELAFGRARTYQFNHLPRAGMYEIASFGADTIPNREYRIHLIRFSILNNWSVGALVVIALIVIAKSIAASKSLATPPTHAGSMVSQDTASDTWCYDIVGHGIQTTLWNWRWIRSGVIHDKWRLSWQQCNSLCMHNSLIMINKSSQCVVLVSHKLIDTTNNSNTKAKIDVSVDEDGSWRKKKFKGGNWERRSKAVRRYDTRYMKSWDEINDSMNMQCAWIRRLYMSAD